ncbi:MAG TPA: DUF2017 domain-containing protein [Micromonosporaceae bacterium]
MGTFHREGSYCVATFTADETRVLRKIATEVVVLLSDGFNRGDPAIGRLFPDIYPDRPAESAEFRRYTERELKTGKIDQAGAVLAALPADGGGEVRLDDEAAQAWLRALNDARLALAVRLEITTATDLSRELVEAARDPQSARAFQLSVYAYLGHLQESLLDALLTEPGAE